MYRLEEKKRKKIITEETDAWRKIERYYANYCRYNKKFALSIAETTERNNIIKNEEKMQTLLSFYIDKFVSHDIYSNIYSDFDFDNNELRKSLHYSDIWDTLVDIIHCMFNIDQDIEKYKLDKRIDVLKNDLDDHYGITPEDESSAALCKIMEFGYGRAEELQLFYDWKDNELTKIKDTVDAINLFYRETKY